MSKDTAPCDARSGHIESTSAPEGAKLTSSSLSSTNTPKQNTREELNVHGTDSLGRSAKARKGNGADNV